jgi:putative transposase
VLRRLLEPKQYTSIAFGRRCREAGIALSMGSTGDAYDNAMAESFFASLETELIDRSSWRTRADARLAVFDYIEAFYNPRRRHSALGYLSPVEFERGTVPRRPLLPDRSPTTKAGQHQSSSSGPLSFSCLPSQRWGT